MSKPQATAKKRRSSASPKKKAKERKSLYDQAGSLLMKPQGERVWNKFWHYQGEFTHDDENLKPFLNLFGEDDTLHEAIKLRFKIIPDRNGYIHAPEFWRILFRSACVKDMGYNIEKEVLDKALILAIRLAKTPDSIWDPGVWEKDTLRARQDTSAWFAAQQIMGTQRWKARKRVAETSSQRETKETKIDEDDATTERNEENNVSNTETDEDYDTTARNKEQNVYKDDSDKEDTETNTTENNKDDTDEGDSRKDLPESTDPNISKLFPQESATTKKRRYQLQKIGTENTNATQNGDLPNRESQPLRQ